jgi:hypothetical protein
MRCLTAGILLERSCHAGHAPSLLECCLQCRRHTPFEEDRAQSIALMVFCRSACYWNTLSTVLQRRLSTARIHYSCLTSTSCKRVPWCHTRCDHPINELRLSIQLGKVQQRHPLRVPCTPVTCIHGFMVATYRHRSLCSALSPAGDNTDFLRSCSGLCSEVLCSLGYSCPGGKGRWAGPTLGSCSGLNCFQSGTVGAHGHSDASVSCQELSSCISRHR